MNDQTQQRVSIKIPESLLTLEKCKDTSISIDIHDATISPAQAQSACDLIRQKLESPDIEMLEGGYEKLFYLLVTNQMELQVLGEKISDLQAAISKLYNDIYRKETAE